MDDETMPERRCRNILSAIDNLLTHLEANESTSILAIRIREMRHVYALEYEFYRSHEAAWRVL